ncbi:hypothetical protein [Roseiarcus fermentans]|nr:hypothetical protein [Roseiarcus fermentans]
MARQLANPFPDHLLAVVAFWACLLFLGDGLVATPNAVTVSAHLLGSIAVACAVFRILELSHPDTGVIRLSPSQVDRLVLRPGDEADAEPETGGSTDRVALRT